MHGHIHAFLRNTTPRQDFVLKFTRLGAQSSWNIDGKAQKLGRCQVSVALAKAVT